MRQRLGQPRAYWARGKADVPAITRRTPDFRSPGARDSRVLVTAPFDVDATISQSPEGTRVSSKVPAPSITTNACSSSPGEAGPCGMPAERAEILKVGTGLPAASTR